MTNESLRQLKGVVEMRLRNILTEMSTAILDELESGTWPEPLWPDGS